MRRKFLLPLLLLLLLSACVQPQTAETTAPAETAPTVTVPATEPTTLPAHSALYDPSVAVEDVIRYFAEVCLDAEIINSGDPSRLQKWAEPIRYQICGNPTAEDLATLEAFTRWLNSLEGFPGIAEAENIPEANFPIHFCTQEEMLGLMGPGFDSMDGAVTFWYDNDRIYHAIVCIRTDLDQHLRNSVILEELYNSLGPIQDTRLRQDSIIYAEYSEPQALTPMDELLLKLLYHPSLECGMTSEECESAIRNLYY